MNDRYKSDISKVIKNPLLTAAGSGFPYENFSANALLMPVSSGSSIIPDDTEADSFIGQEPQALLQTAVPTAKPSVDSTPFPLFTNEQKNVASDPFLHIGFTAQQENRSITPRSNHNSPGTQEIPLKLSPVESELADWTHSAPSQWKQPGTEPKKLETVGVGTIVADIPLQSTGGDSFVGVSLPAGVVASPIPPTANAQIGPPQLPFLHHVPQANSNTFRLGSHRKPLYAQPPGLSSNSPSLSNSPPLAPVADFKQFHVPAQSSENVPPFFQPKFSSANMASVDPSSIDSKSTEALQYQTLDSTSLAAPTVVPQLLSGQNQGHNEIMYRPIYHHWFFKKEVESKVLWKPFSMMDSLALEEAFTSPDLTPETVVATDGGRYDVNILRRQRNSVYWEEKPTEVRRCSWFSKGAVDAHYVPYDENTSTKLEEEFKIATTSNTWHRRVELASGETIVFHGPNVMVHFPQATSPDAWGNTPQVQTRPRVVKRGVVDFEIDDGEPAKIDHILFLVHGIGSVCDLKFRAVEEVVDDFRCIALQLLQSHFKSSSEQGVVNRIEIIPVSWHKSLHSEDTGIDRKLKCITLPSIPKLRHFTNDTVLDVLFYTSPVYCQTIMHTVGNELNRLYDLFQQRNPSFEGGVSVGGHSLGTLILFDLLCHQKPMPQSDLQETELFAKEDSPEQDTSEDGEDTLSPLSAPSHPTLKRRLSRRVSYVMGTAGTGQPCISYPQLTFSPKAFFALGSPIGMFVTVRGLDALGEDFHFPTCPAFFNIFHPFDPVAYRIETLINPEFEMVKPVLIPHHKGRKRMHLELKETMSRIGSDLKQMLLDSVRSTWNTVYQLAMFHRNDEAALETELNKVLEEEIKKKEADGSQAGDTDTEIEIPVGQLNSGRRIDYVLQEAPIESFNEYIFAMGSHVCYWESEDTILMILKEIYGTLGIGPDSHSTQHNLHIERKTQNSKDSDISSGPLDLSDNASYYNSSVMTETPPSSSTPPMGTFPLSLQSSSTNAKNEMLPPTPTYLLSDTNLLNQAERPIGMDPTAPLTENKNLGPPPMSGFIRK